MSIVLPILPYRYGESEDDLHIDRITIVYYIPFSQRSKYCLTKGINSRKEFISDDKWLANVTEHIQHSFTRARHPTIHAQFVNQFVDQIADDSEEDVPEVVFSDIVKVVTVHIS